MYYFCIEGVIAMNQGFKGVSHHTLYMYRVYLTCMSIALPSVILLQDCYCLLVQN